MSTTQSISKYISCLTNSHYCYGCNDGYGGDGGCCCYSFIVAVVKPPSLDVRDKLRDKDVLSLLSLGSESPLVEEKTEALSTQRKPRKELATIAKDDSNSAPKKKPKQKLSSKAGPPKKRVCTTIRAKWWITFNLLKEHYKVHSSSDPSERENPDLFNFVRIQRKNYCNTMLNLKSTYLNDEEIRHLLVLRDEDVLENEHDDDERLGWS